MHAVGGIFSNLKADQHALEPRGGMTHEQSRNSSSCAALMLDWLTQRMPSGIARGKTPSPERD